MLNLAILLAFGGVAYAALLVVLTARTLSHPPRYTVGAAIARGRPSDPSELAQPRAFSSWTLHSRGRELSAWDIPGDDPLGPVVVMTHGWSDSRLGALPRLPGVLECASRVVAWDMPGHGDAPGLCDLGATEWIDLCTLLDRLTDADAQAPGKAGTNEGPHHEESPLATRDVILFGWSLGAGVSLRAAVEWNAWRQPVNKDHRAHAVRILGVICEAPYRVPFTPASRVLRLRRMPWRMNLSASLWLVHARTGGMRGANALGLRPAATPIPRGFRDFDRAVWAERFAAAGGRVLVLHGTNDPVCPIADGRAIARAAGPRGSIETLAGASHNDLWTDPGFAPRCAASTLGFIRARTRGAYDPA